MLCPFPKILSKLLREVQIKQIVEANPPAEEVLG